MVFRQADNCVMEERHVPEIEKLAEVYRNFGDVSGLVYPVGMLADMTYYGDVIRKYFGELTEEQKQIPLRDLVSEDIRTDFLIDFMVSSAKFRRKDAAEVRNVHCSGLQR